MSTKVMITTAGWLLQDERNRNKVIANIKAGGLAVMQILPEDLGGFAAAPVVGGMAIDIARSAGGGMLLAFDLPEDSPEVWEIRECRLWADGMHDAIESGALRGGASVTMQRGDDVEVMDIALALIRAHNVIDVLGDTITVIPSVHA